MQLVMGLSNWETRYCLDESFLGVKKVSHQTIQLPSSHTCIGLILISVVNGQV